MQSRVSAAVNQDLQWICCIEKFRFLKLVIVKELSLMCIQTVEVKTWHVTPKLNADIDFNDDVYSALYTVQVAKHKMGWHDGSVSEPELHDEMEGLLGENSPIFVIDRDDETYLSELGFVDV